jgi:hypothetical protein
MKIHLTIIFLLITPFLFAQVNLVPNPSFEDTTVCPDGMNQVNRAVGWSSFGNTPNYWNACSQVVNVPNTSGGFQNAFDGVAFCGVYTLYSGITGSPDYREYIGVQLISSLMVGQKYFVSCKINKPNNLECATNNFGVLFSTVPYTETNPVKINTTPQIITSQIVTDTLNWFNISGSFIADSIYKYAILGNFYNDSITDTILYNGQTDCIAYYFIDMVCVSTDSLTCNTPDAINENNINNKIKIFPNPATDELTIDFALTDKSYFELYDVIGAKRKAVILDIGTQTKRIGLTDIDSGLYFYSVVDRKGNRIKTGKLVVIK